ncbi:MAG TPA: C25 family cysteine peptidase [Candidatus Paceibacterota bacterium]|nr:C25 family cysteine peptidase [Verrucomicrobiota bacterium]HRY51495.1 C25 family cysteine peptidase [Candidatus Paceibacterota bacterium]
MIMKRWLFVVLMIHIGVGIADARGQSARRVWVSLDGVSKEGTPIQAEVLDTNPKETQVHLKVPGVWRSTETYGGRTFTRLWLPEVQLAGKGIPLRQGERGWYDFPEETGYPPLPLERYQKGLETGVPRPVFPESAVGKQPRTLKEMMELGIDPAGARPGIPALRGFMAVSRNTSVKELILERAKQVTQPLALGAPLIPAGYEGSDQFRPPEDGYTPPELVDEEFYGQFEGSYWGAEATFSEISGFGSFAVSELRVPLVEYVNAKEVRIVIDVVLLLKHLQGVEDFDCPISWDSWIYNLPFINGQALRESLTAKGLRIEASRSAHYLILTPRDYRDELDEFALWKQSKGLNVDFAYVGAAAGDDVLADRNQIDGYIEKYFQEHYCHGVYVLLVGDVEALPAGRSTRVTGNPDGADGDSDHVYEVLGNDRFPSLYVGRLSVDSAEDLKAQLEKILRYEKSPAVGSWPSQVTLAANSQNNDDSYGVSPSFPSKYAQAVNEIAGYGGYDSPPAFQVLHAGAATATATRAINQDVVDAINRGRGQVLYRGHGGGSAWLSGWDGSSTTGASFTSSTHLPMLKNPAFPIVFSIACQNARLRLSDSIAEEWMSLPNAGAVAHYGASVNSKTGENHERAKGIYRAIYESGFTRLAPALAEAERISHSVTGGGSSWDNNTFCYLLLGDPELTIRRKSVVGEFHLQANLRSLKLDSAVDVIDSAGKPVSLALVNATLEDGSRRNGFTGASGQLVIAGVSPDKIVQLDISADGYRPETVNTQPERPVWVSLDGQSQPGAPIRTEIVSTTPQETKLQLTIPGYWLRNVTYGGELFTRIELPAAQLQGKGIPVQLGERGWYDFPAETGYPPMNSERYRRAFEVGVRKPIFPASAIGMMAPSTGKEMEMLGIDPAGARPGIPMLRGYLAVSRKNRAEDIVLKNVETSTKTIDLNAPLAPAGYEGEDQITLPPIIPPIVDLVPGYNPPELIDEEFYGQFQGSYAGTEPPLSEISGFGPFGTVQVRIPLVEYLSPTQIRVAASVVLYASHLQGVEDFTCPISWDSWMFNLPFINGEALRESLTAKGLRIEASRSAHYLILTPFDYRDELQEFALWKQHKGLTVDFVYVGTGGGDSLAADRNAIDSYIESYFKEHYCNGVYVLLVGDVNTIPAGRSSRVIANPDGADADSDHVYEVLGSDRFPSMYVGRLSVNSANDLKNQLAKILSYERSPVPGNWPRRATLAANSQNDDDSMGVSSSFPSKYAKAVNEAAGYGGYSDPPTFQVLHAGAASAAATRAVNQDVINAIHNGRGQVLYRGHGGGNSWLSGWDGSSSYGTSFSDAAHVSQLTNNAYPIVYSIACQNARLRLSDCIAEAWMSRVNGGAAAHWGASVNSYTSENHERAKGIFRALYESGYNHLGPALAEAERISYSTTGGGDGWDNNTFCYLLLGDPEMSVRREFIAGNLRLSSEVLAANLGALIKVQNNAGTLVPGALVSVDLVNGIRTNGFTGEQGELVLAGINPDVIRGLALFADGYPAEILGSSINDRLRLSAIGFNRLGQFQLRLEGPTGTYEIQASSDLAKWQSIGTVVIKAEPVDFLDQRLLISAERARFYRAVGRP